MNRDEQLLVLECVIAAASTEILEDFNAAYRDSRTIAIAAEAAYIDRLLCELMDVDAVDACDYTGGKSWNRLVDARLANEEM